MADPVRRFASGFLLPVRGGALLLAPGLLALALAPAVLGLVVAGGVGVALARHPDLLVGVLWSRPADCDLDSAWALVTCGAWSLTRLVVDLVAVAFAAVVSARIAAAPFMDLLAARLLRARGVRPPPGVTVRGDLPLVTGAALSLAGGLRRFAIYAAGLLVLFALLLVPGGAAVSTPLGFAWTALWVHLDTVQYALQWVGPARTADAAALGARRPFETAGFALAQGLLSMVPLVGALCVPATVAAACLYVEGDPAPADAPGLVPAA